MNHSPVIEHSQSRNPTYECTEEPNHSGAVHEKLERNYGVFGPVFLNEVPCYEDYCADDERGEDICWGPSILFVFINLRLSLTLAAFMAVKWG